MSNETDESEDLSVPIDLRTHEAAPMHEYRQQALAALERAEMDEAAENVGNVQIHDDYATATPDQWKDFVLSLHDHVDDGLRPWWLAKKVTSRLRGRVGDLT